MPKDLTIGIAGCGTMGLPMAETLLKAGIDVWGHDVRPASDFGAFADRMIEDAATFADRVDAVISVVRDSQQTDELMLGHQAILTHPNGPKTAVLSSTLSPRYIQEFATRAPNGVELIDAPMSGAPYRAANGTLTFMVGGGPGVDRVMPFFQIMGGDVHHLGPFGSGMACKVLNNFVGITGVIAVRKALAGADMFGLDQDQLLSVMKSSSGATWYGDNLDKIDWAHEGYDPANTIGIIEKDVRAYLDGIGGGGTFEEELIREIQSLEPLASKLAQKRDRNL